ncbi:MAG: DUF4878 domain-containing protein [Gloeobacteraceae cyanobacterium ES-bin-316]|nr:DUF4878 domain-containing protein [Ferruginibacter sp.]
MTNKIVFFLLCIAAIAYTGCTNNSAGDPKIVLTDFFEAMAKKDMAKARSLATADSKSTLDMWEQKMNLDASAIDKYDKTKVEMGEAKISGDNATVPIKEKTSGETVNFPLQKEGGGWKVSFSMTSLMQMGIEKMNEKGINLTDSLSNVMDKLKNINIDSLQREMQKAGKDLDSAAKILEGLKN